LFDVGDQDQRQLLPDHFVAVRSGMYPVRQALQLTAPVSDLRELVGDLRAGGVAWGPVPMASINPTAVATIAALTGGSLHGLAAVLKAYFSRHRDRALLLHRDGSVQLSGMSEEEMTRHLNTILQAALEDQAGSDDLWDEVMGPRDAWTMPPVRAAEDNDPEGSADTDD
jgi:hypothetical protein